MPDLAFAVIGARAVADGLAPLLEFDLEICNRPENEDIRALLLQIEILVLASGHDCPVAQREAGRRVLSAAESTAPPGARLWARVQATAPAFAGRVVVPLVVPCSYDLNLAATRHFSALQDACATLAFRVSGTMIHARAGDGLQVEPVPADREAIFSLPGAPWTAMMERRYPGSAWLYCRRDVITRLQRFRVQRALESWDDTLEVLLAAAGAEPVSA